MAGVRSTAHSLAVIPTEGRNPCAKRIRRSRITCIGTITAAFGVECFAQRFFGFASE